MSAISNYLLELEEVVDPMVYIGHTDDEIIAEVKLRVPDAPISWIYDIINRARFDNA